MLENDVVLMAMYGYHTNVPTNLSDLVSVHSMFQLLYATIDKSNKLNSGRGGQAISIFLTTILILITKNL